MPTSICGMFFFFMSLLAMQRPSPHFDIPLLDKSWRDSNLGFIVATLKFRSLSHLNIYISGHKSALHCFIASACWSKAVMCSMNGRLFPPLMLDEDMNCSMAADFTWKRFSIFLKRRLQQWYVPSYIRQVSVCDIGSLNWFEWMYFIGR